MLIALIALAGLLIGVVEGRLLIARQPSSSRTRARILTIALPATLGAFSALAAWRHPGPDLAVVLLTGAFAGPLAWIDQHEHRLPNRLLGPWMLLLIPYTWIVQVTGSGRPTGTRALLGGAAALTLFVVMYAAQRGRIGEGDVKLAGCIGASAAAISVMTWFESLTAGLTLLCVHILILKARHTTAAFPWGPALLAGACATILA